MVVMAMQNVSESLRGELTRYMLEIQAGVFVGQLNARVTELLWNKVRESIGFGGAFLVRSDDSEQGFSINMVGNSNRIVENVDGLTFIKYQNVKTLN